MGTYRGIFTDTHTLFHDNYNGYLQKHLKLYEITRFPTGSSAYYQIIIQFTKVLSHHYAVDA